MINVIIIYLAQHFQRKKSDAMIRIAPFNPLTQGSIFFPNFFFFHGQNG
jgi:hypothetical protein